VAAVDKDATKFFEANNKAAGTRARKHLQQLKTLAQVCHQFGLRRMLFVLLSVAPLKGAMHSICRHRPLASYIF